MAYAKFRFDNLCTVEVTLIINYFSETLPDHGCPFKVKILRCQCQCSVCVCVLLERLMNRWNIIQYTGMTLFKCCFNTSLVAKIHVVINTPGKYPSRSLSNFEEKLVFKSYIGLSPCLNKKILLDMLTMCVVVLPSTLITILIKF